MMASIDGSVILGSVILGSVMCGLSGDIWEHREPGTNREFAYHFSKITNTAATIRANPRI